MDLPLDDRLRIGVQTIHRRTEPAEGPWLPTIDEMSTLVGLVDRGGYDSLWVGDHISFPLAIFDPLLQLAQAAVVSQRLLLGTGVYLLPLRHPTPVAKQVSTLDHLSEGRFIFGLVPLVTASGAGAATQRAVGTAVFGGMIAASFLGIFVIPGLYVTFEGLREKIKGMIGGKTAASPKPTEPAAH